MSIFGGRNTSRDIPSWLASEAPAWLSLKQTIAWCGPRADTSNPQGCLRTPELAPRMLEPSYEASVHTVTRNRWFQLFHERKHLVEPDVQRFDVGSLLAFFPNAELACGTAEAETGGYFDVHNTPPWDTWVTIVHDPSPADASYDVCVVSLVPPEFVAAVEAGISVNPEECIRWVAHCAPKMQQLVQEAITCPAPA